MSVHQQGLWLVVDGDCCSVRIDDGTVVPDRPSLDGVPDQISRFSFVATVYEGDYERLVDTAYNAFLDEIGQKRHKDSIRYIELDLPDKMEPMEEGYKMRLSLELCLPEYPGVYTKITGTHVTPLVRSMLPQQARARDATLHIVERATDMTSSGVLPALQEIVRPCRTGFFVYEMQHSTVIVEPCDTNDLLTTVAVELLRLESKSAHDYYDLICQRTGVLLTKALDDSPSVIFKGDYEPRKAGKELLYFINGRVRPTRLLMNDDQCE